MLYKCIKFKVKYVVHMIFRSMKDFLKVHWSNSQDFAKVTVIIRYLTVLVIMQIKDKSTRHQIIGKSNPITKVEVEVDGLLYFTPN